MAQRAFVAALYASANFSSSDTLALLQTRAEALGAPSAHAHTASVQAHVHDSSHIHTIRDGVVEKSHAHASKKKPVGARAAAKAAANAHPDANTHADTQAKDIELLGRGGHGVDGSVQNAGNGDSKENGLVTAYCAALFCMVCVVTIMFYPMGTAVVCQVVLYVSCLAFVKLAMKEVFRLGFAYPTFITAVHLLVSSVAAFSVLFYRRIANGTPIAVPTREEVCYGILPIALTFGFSIGAENSALVFVSAAFSEVVAASNPVMSAFLTWACGMTFALQLLAPIAVVVLGCVVSISGELYFSAFGLGLLLFSVFCRGLKAVMQQKLMTGETKDKFDPCTLMAWTCLYSCVEMVAYSAATEGAAPFRALVAAPDTLALAVAIAISAAIACTLNISALFVIKQLGAVGMQMVSQMKSLLVVIGGIALLSESFTFRQQVGFATVLIGVYWYSHMRRVLEPNAKGH